MPPNGSMSVGWSAGDLERHRVDREVAARQVGLDVGGELDVGLAAVGPVGLGAVGRDLELRARPSGADGAEPLALGPQRVGPRPDDRLDLRRAGIGGQVDVAVGRVRRRGRRAGRGRCRPPGTAGGRRPRSAPASGATRRGSAGCGRGSRRPTLPARSLRERRAIPSVARWNSREAAVASTSTAPGRPTTGPPVAVAPQPATATVAADERRERVEVVAALEERDHATARAPVDAGRAVRSRVVARLRPMSVSGSSRWPSKPAEIRSHVGPKRVDGRRDHLVERSGGSARRSRPAASGC